MIVLRYMQALCAFWSLLFSRTLQAALSQSTTSIRHESTTAAVLVACVSLFLASLVRMYGLARGYCEAFFHCLLTRHQRIYLII